MDWQNGQSSYFQDFQRKRAAWKNKNVSEKCINECH